MSTMKALDLRNRNYLISALLFLLAAYCTVFVYADKLQFPTVKKVEYKRIFFAGGSSDPAGLPTVTTSSGNQTGTDEEFSVSFRMNVSKADNYSNVFQTGPGNTGVRMELVHPSLLGVIVGARNSQGFKGFLVTKSLELDSWHSVRLSIDKRTRLKVFLDGVKRIDASGEPLKYAVSDIAIGTGFDKTRPFNGELADFNLEYGLYKRNSTIGNMITLIQAILLALTLLILIVLVSHSRNYLVPSLGVILGLYILTSIYSETLQCTVVNRVGAYSEITLLLFLIAASAAVVIQVGELLQLQSLTRIQKTDLIGLLIVAGFTIAVFFHYVLGAYLQLGYPFDTFLFDPHDRFSDFFHMYNVNSNLNPYFEDYPIKSNYYPFANMVFYLFALIPRGLSVAIFTGIFVLPLVCFNGIALHSNNRTRHVINVFIFSFLTYPLLYTVDRGNVEGLLCILLLLFVHFFAKQRALLGSAFLALAIAMKGYPALLLIFLLSERKFKEAIIAGAGAAAVTVVCLLFFREGFANNFYFVFSGFNLTNIAAFSNNNYVFTGLSLFSLIKVFFIETGIINNVDMAAFKTVYVWSVVGLSIALAVYVIFVEKERWKKIALLVGAALLFPHISFDYKLMLVFIPMFLFLNSDEKSGCNLLYVLIFGLLLIPKAYYFFPNIVSNSRLLSISVLLNPLILSVMMFTIVADGIRHRFEFLFSTIKTSA
jgi:hypothetical protein